MNRHWHGASYPLTDFSGKLSQSFEQERLKRKLWQSGNPALWFINKSQNQDHNKAEGEHNTAHKQSYRDNWVFDTLFNLA